MRTYGSSKSFAAAACAWRRSTSRGRSEQPLDGLRFVVTGRLRSFSRSQIEDKIKELGGVVTGSVSRRTTYLVAGEDAGSKLADAQRLGVQVATEEDILGLIGQRQA